MQVDFATQIQRLIFINFVYLQVKEVILHTCGFNVQLVYVIYNSYNNKYLHELLILSMKSGWSSLHCKNLSKYKYLQHS